MERIAAFERVSQEQFISDWVACFGDDTGAAQAYRSIRLPKRATAGSAGYDFILPCRVELEPGQSIRVPTGIRARIADGWVLQIFPRSGLGFKYRLQLDNTVGIIDADYYNAKNEGHIQIQITNDGKSGRVLTLDAGDGFAQGIFLLFGITEDDEADGVRVGGFGSTGQ